MSPLFLNPRHVETPFIRLNARHCKACWNCLEQCPRKVFGKIDLPVHRHALILYPAECTGCLKCVSICPGNALSIKETLFGEGSERNFPEKTDSPPGRIFLRRMINPALLLTGLMMAVSGWILQFTYHMGSHRGITASDVQWGLDYGGWSSVHKVSIVFVSLLMIYHLRIHWKWYKTVVRKHLLSKNHPTIWLTVFFSLTAITGFSSWMSRFWDTPGATEAVSSAKFFIEIHDKLALVLSVYLILHVIKRIRMIFRP